MTETEAIRENYNLGVLAGEAREQARIIKLLATQWLPIADIDKCIALIKAGN